MQISKHATVLTDGTRVWDVRIHGNHYNPHEEITLDAVSEKDADDFIASFIRLCEEYTIETCEDTTD